MEFKMDVFELILTVIVPIVVVDWITSWDCFQCAPHKILMSESKRAGTKGIFSLKQSSQPKDDWDDELTDHFRR
jgi:hypothetical protein